MREILFRGKRVDNGEWVEGNLFIPDKVARVDVPTEILMGTNIVRISYEVDRETVCRYTGLKDKNGKRIFEGDIVRLKGGFVEMAGEVVFCEACFYIFDGDTHEGLRYESECFEIIGNIHDNPELLED